MKKYKNTLVLSSKDLTIEGRRKSIDNVSCYDTLLSLQQFANADFVIYIDDNKCKIFKDRFGGY